VRHLAYAFLIEESMKSRALTSAFLLALLACGPTDRSAELVKSGGGGSGRATPSESTVRANADVLGQLPFDDTSDFENARRGLIGQRQDPIIRTAEGQVVWNLDDFTFQEGEPPDSVNPSLWRQAKLNRIHGLFEVMEGVYQVRGYDLANMTLVAGNGGWIVIDPMTTTETARAAMELVEEHLGKRPVTGLIYTHSHIDHFGGARGVLPDATGVPVLAPEGFVIEAVSENVLAGNTMTRRASYMFGFLIERGPRGKVDSGLGKASTPGSFGLVPPTEFIIETGTERVIDGVRLVFQNTPGAEAPAEMMIYLPDKNALCGAENVSHVLHNVYTLRGAKVRDALLWSRYLDETIRLFGHADLVFASHHWPTWGNDQVLEYLKKQRDIYKYIHDQTMRLANHGYTMLEIAEQIELPESLARTFAVRGYYGTVNHNSKAVYQHYFGFFDGNPANLHPLPPEQAGPRYVEFMGGADAVLEKSRAAYERGEYRFIAMVLNHLVFAEPENIPARELLADTYDQLAYRAESGPWRDFYLTGAQELRVGMPTEFPLQNGGTVDIIGSVPMDLFFDALAVRLNGPEADGEQAVLEFVFTDTGETHVLVLENAVLHHYRGEARGEEVDTTVKMTRDLWNEVVAKQTTFQAEILAGNIDVDGSRLKLLSFFSLLDDFSPGFEIVRP
jgi:alkyl sulfatase BDS1-like metallo-beta-lactamase superfamily hydrolase